MADRGLPARHRETNPLNGPSEGHAAGKAANRRFIPEDDVGASIVYLYSDAAGEIRESRYVERWRLVRAMTLYRDLDKSMLRLIVHVALKFGEGGI